MENIINNNDIELEGICSNIILNNYYNDNKNILGITELIYNDIIIDKTDNIILNNFIKETDLYNSYNNFIDNKYINDNEIGINENNINDNEIDIIENKINDNEIGINENKRNMISENDLNTITSNNTSLFVSSNLSENTFHNMIDEKKKYDITKYINNVIDHNHNFIDHTHNFIDHNHNFIDHNQFIDHTHNFIDHNQFIDHTHNFIDHNNNNQFIDNNNINGIKYNYLSDYNLRFLDTDINNRGDWATLNNINNINNNNVELFKKQDTNITVTSLESEHSNKNSLILNKIPNIIPKQQPKNIRIKKKVYELDDVDYLYNKLQDYVRNIIISRYNFMLLIIYAMEIIENYSINNKNNKKLIVLKSLKQLILVDLDLNSFDQKFFLSSMSNFIELFIYCSHNNISQKSKLKKDNDNFYFINSGQIIYSIIDKITTIIIKNQYTSDRLFNNIPTITNILMILTNKYIFLKGIEKKNIVILSINQFFKHKLQYIINITEDKKNDLILTLDSVPMTIDLFISIKKGKYNINKKKSFNINKPSWIKSLFHIK